VRACWSRVKLTRESGPPPGCGGERHYQCALTTSPRPFQVRAAFRAASLAMPTRMRGAAPRCAAASGERLVLRRSRAERLACRESSAFDAAPCPSRFNAFETARARLRDGAWGFRLPWPVS
jgi:hypothetical protein